MKSIVLTMILVLASSNAFAMSKNCEGARNEDDVKGDKFTAQVTQQSVEIKDGSQLDGTYPIAKKSDTVGWKRWQNLLAV